jgi:uncharacterized protein (DUF2147 family)
MNKNRRTERVKKTTKLKLLNRNTLVMVIIVFGLAVVLGVGMWRSQKQEPQSSTSLTQVKTSGRPALAAETKPDFQKLIGKWMRPDGGYVIEIKNILSDGKIDCAYFNPSPIKISKADAADENGKTKVFIELRDEGYPGCTYNLIYDPERDLLTGVYYQAAVKESYDIFFVRVKNTKNLSL